MSWALLPLGFPLPLVADNRHSIYHKTDYNNVLEDLNDAVGISSSRIYPLIYAFSQVVSCYGFSVFYNTDEHPFLIPIGSFLLFFCLIYMILDKNQFNVLVHPNGSSMLPSWISSSYFRILKVCSPACRCSLI